MKLRYINIKLTILLIGTAFITGCSRPQPAPEVVVVRDSAPGVVEYIWEEPMVDVIDVPPGLDPDGIYYRPGHQQVVEIRQGRWQYHKQGKPEQVNE